MFVNLHGHMAQILTLNKNGPSAQRSSGSRLVGIGSVREQELLEGFGEHLGGIGS
jgi:hypothetical protein